MPVTKPLPASRRMGAATVTVPVMILGHHTCISGGTLPILSTIPFIYLAHLALVIALAINYFMAVMEAAQEILEE